jgi:hypothetical protein
VVGREATGAFRSKRDCMEPIKPSRCSCTTPSVLQQRRLAPLFDWSVS